ncbi:MAG: hypothetical protein L0Y71_01195 [Gemmataceae bacterium]|nr:hypothetical protein [Gemmataceae bacterium]
MALRILVDGLLGAPATAINLNQFASRTGWASRLNILPVVIKHLHYQTDADALAFVIDSDFEALHSPAHDAPNSSDPRCRYCTARKTIEQTRASLRTVPGRAPLNIGIGLAVPCFEAWLRCGVDPHVTEAAWSVALASRQFPYDQKRLKIAVYGTDTPHLALATTRMTDEARRLVSCLDRLEREFPNGFGLLACEVRSW